MVNDNEMEENMNTIAERMWHKRLSDFEVFDEITLKVSPRYKESGLSGDEWRQHVQVHFMFKGHVVHSCGYGDMNTALMMIGAEKINCGCPIADKVLKLEEDCCDQPSCGNPPTHRHILKSLYSSVGEKLDPSEAHSKYYRQFCQKHGTRGDCGLEDADSNYVKEPL